MAFFKGFSHFVLKIKSTPESVQKKALVRQNLSKLPDKRFYLFRTANLKTD